MTIAVEPLCNWILMMMMMVLYSQYRVNWGTNLSIVCILCNMFLLLLRVRLPCQRCASTAMGLNGNGHFNGMGTAVAPVSIAASAGSRCSCR